MPQPPYPPLPRLAPPQPDEERPDYAARALHCVITYGEIGTYDLDEETIHQAATYGRRLSMLELSDAGREVLTAAERHLAAALQRRQTPRRRPLAAAQTTTANGP